MQRLERGRKSCRLMAESGLSACGVCQVWFADASFAGCEEATHRRAMCAMRDSARARARQRWGGQGWMEKDSARGPLTTCSVLACHVVAAAGCAGRRRSQTHGGGGVGRPCAASRQPWSESATPTRRTPRSDAIVPLHGGGFTGGTQKQLGSLGVFECLWVSLGGFRWL